MIYLPRLKEFLKRYTGEVTTTVSGAVIGIFVAKLAGDLLESSVMEAVTFGLTSAVLVVVVGLSVSIKRNLTWKIRYLQESLPDLFARGSLFSIRLTHFPEEKNLLADSVVRVVLPRLINETQQPAFRSPLSPPKHIGIVVDSGTTLAPIFPRLRRHGFGSALPSNVCVRIYTNSLAGIEAFNRDASKPERIAETDIQLLGGEPLEVYRATTGDMTTKAMGEIKNESDQKDGLIIGLTTANWVLVGRGYDKLILCAKGRGHLDFKKELDRISHTVVVVAPLGKLLALGSVEELNEILKTERVPKYDGHDLSNRKRKNVLLLTTARKKTSSILFQHSTDLANAHCEQPPPGYGLAVDPRSLIYDPRLAPAEQLQLEVPHEYLRNYRQRLLKIIA